jgi:predicted small metal-binding protein
MADEKRKVIDCRLYPSERNCTLSIEGTEEEVLEAASQHAVTAHGHTNSPELREQLRTLLKDAKD